MKLLETIKKFKLPTIVKKYWPLGFLLGIWVVFFYKFFLKGLIPLPLDIVVGMYFPWLNYKWGYSVGVPVRNHLISDVVSQSWIWRNWAIELLKQGRLAIWNPHSFAGYPLSPWFHTAVLSPINLFYFIANKMTSMGIIISSQTAIGMLSMFLLVKEHLKSNLSGLFSAIGFAFSAYFIGWLTWGTISLTLSFIPLVLFFIKKLESNFNQGNLIGLWGAYLCALLGGYPQAFLHLNIILAVYLCLVFKDGSLLRYQKKKIIGTLILVNAAASVVLLPSLQILNLSIRGYETHLASKNYGFLSLPKIIILTFAPNFYGNPATGNYWGGGKNFNTYLVWFGTINLIMALFGTFSKKERLKKMGLIVIGIGLILSLKYPLGWLVYELKIPLISAIPASRNLFLVSFGGTILTGLAVKRLIAERVDLNQWRKTFLVWSGIVIGLSLGLGINFLVLKKLTPPVDLAHLQPVFNNIKVGLRNSVVPVSVSLILLTGVYLILWIKKKWLTNFLIFGFLILVIAEAFYFGWKYLPFTKSSYYFPETKTLRFLNEKSQEEFFRVERQSCELLPPNMWMAYDLYSTAGYDPVYPKTYADWLIKNEFTGSYTRYIEWDRPKIFFDEMGVKYFLALKRNPQGKATDQGSLPYWLDKEKWIEVESEGPVVILENKDFQPAYFLESGQGQVDLIRKENNLWEFRVKIDKNDRLVLKENYFPGWRVYIDGRPAEIEKDENTFKAAAVQEGEHTVKFIYQNNLIKKGAVISVLSIFAFILLNCNLLKKSSVSVRST